MADNTRDTVVVERGNNGMGIFVALAAIVLVAIAAYFVVNQTRNDNARTDAVTAAAKDVGDTAKKAGDSLNPDK